MHVPQLVRIHFKVFQLLGFCPLREFNLSKRGRFKNSIISSIWSCLLLGILLFQTGIAYHFDKVVFSSEDLFSKFNNILKFVVISIVSYTVQIISIVRRHESFHFWESYNNLCRNHKIIIRDTNRILSINMFFVKIYVYIILCVIAEINVEPLFKIGSFQTTYFFRILYLCPMIVLRFHYFYYLMYVEILRANLRTLNEEVELIIKLSKMSTRTSKNHRLDNFVLERLKGAQSFYNLIYEMADWVNESFGWTLLANFLNSFVQLLSDSYWIYWQLYKRFTFYLFGNLVNCF